MCIYVGRLRETRDEILSVEWQIDGFLSLSGSLGTEYSSPAFMFSDSSWSFRIYPYGEDFSNDVPDRIPLYLYKLEHLTEIVTWKFGVKKADDTVRFNEILTQKFVDIGEYGSPTFLKRSEFLPENADLAPSGVLTIICLLKKPPNQELNVLSIDLEGMLTSKKHSDVTIYVGQKEYEAHKVILAARSSVFDAMFDDEMLENSKTVHIEGCDSESFKDFLHFLYTGRADIISTNVFHLYKTADKFSVEGLMSHCVAFMRNELSVDNICDFLTLGDQHSETELNSLCRDFFVRNVQKIFFTSKWKSFLAENHELANELLQYVIPKMRIEE